MVVDDIVGVGVREPLEETLSWSLLDAMPARRPSDCASRRDWIVRCRDLEARSSGSRGSEWCVREAEKGAGLNMLLPGAGGERGILAGEWLAEEDGERELRRLCWGSRGLEGGKMRSIMELCMITFGVDNHVGRMLHILWRS